MSAATKALLTADEFANLPPPEDGSKQELVRGEVVTMSAPGFVHGKVQTNVAFALELYTRQTDLGRVTVESGVITETGPDTVRGPDVSYWSFATLPADQVPVAYANVAADLCVEVKSPSNTKVRTTRKIREYFDWGVKLVRVVDPEERIVTVYTKAGDGTVLWEDATLAGGDVLPGFSCPVAEFFRGVAA